jgi:poly-gamma-glutamate synthesis protein (capsule biosynthesis protein)
LDRGVNDELELHGDSLLINSFNFLQKQDFLVINLEGTLTDSGNIQADKFNFKSNQDKAEILKNAGITHVSIANNHIFDYGKTGYENTIKAIVSLMD